MRGKVAVIVLALTLGVQTIATAYRPISDSEIFVSPVPSYLVVTVLIPRRFDTAARRREMDYAICIRITYLSYTGTAETVESGRLPISSTALARYQMGDAVESLLLALGTHDPPGPDPGFSSTGVIVDPGETCPF